MTTIDNLDIKIHERYAHDQKILDRTFTKETSLLSSHAEIAATSVIYASKWEELFEMGIKNIPWAAFSPPSFYHQKPNRFFSYRLLPSIYVEDENEDEMDEESERKKENELLKKALQAKKGRNQDSSLFERDKTTIISLLKTVVHLNSLLTQVNSRKLQFQKG
jgi:hypothetical protein